MFSWQIFLITYFYRTDIVKVKSGDLLVAHADSALGLVEQRVLILVGITRQGVSDTLAARLLALGESQQVKDGR
jgi:hypothetical protein